MKQQQRTERKAAAERAVAAYWEANPRLPATIVDQAGRTKVNMQAIFQLSHAQNLYHRILADDDELVRGGYKNGRARGPQL